MVFTTKHVSCCWNFTCRFPPPVSPHPLWRASGLLSRGWSFEGMTFSFVSFLFRDIDNQDFTEGLSELSRHLSRCRFRLTHHRPLTSSTRGVVSFEDAAGALWTSTAPPGVSSPGTTATQWKPATSPTTMVGSRSVDSSHSSVVVLSFKRGSKEKISKTFFSI